MLSVQVIKFCMFESYYFCAYAEFSEAGCLLHASLPWGKVSPADTTTGTPDPCMSHNYIISDI